MSRIVFTVAMGKRKYAEQAVGLARSLRLIGDTTPRVLMTDMSDPEFSKNFDQIVKAVPDASAYMSKLSALDVTDASSVIFLDSDCLGFKRLDRIWSSVEDAEFSVQGSWITSGHWYGEMEHALPRLGLDKMPKFNGGMIFYRRGEAASKIIAGAKRVAAEYDSTGLERFRGVVPDEPCIAISMARTGIGTLLPDTMDLMNTAVGLVGRLELDVMRGRCRYLKHSAGDLRVMEPVVFHAGKYAENAIYWKQLARLAWLERYGERVPFGYMSQTHKLRRSVERRLLKLCGRL